MMKIRRNKKIFTSEIKQRFGFRKLASGLLVSAAIGSFFLVNNLTTVKADTKSGPAVELEQHSEQVDQKSEVKIVKEEADSQIKVNQKANQKLVQESPELNPSHSHIKHYSHDQYSEIADQIINNQNKSVNSTDGSATLYMEGQAVGNTGENTEGQANPNTVSVLLKATGGNNYQISIPNSNAYQVTIPDLSPEAGTFQKNSVNNQTVIDYNLTASGVLNLPFIISTNSNYQAQPTPMGDIGTKTISINWKANGISQQPLTYTQTIKPEMSPQTPSRVQPPVDQVPGVQAGSDVIYTFNVNETTGVSAGNSYPSAQVNSAANFGTVITIPVPAHFELNQELTDLNNQFNDQTTITQPSGVGGAVIITVPKGSGSQNYQALPGYKIVGSYQMEQPNDDLTLDATGEITIKQNQGKNHIVIAHCPSFSERIIGKESTIPIGKYQLVIGNAYSNHYIPKDGKELITNYFGFQNDTIYAYHNDAEITLKIADGLAVQKVSTPKLDPTFLPGTTSYTYIARLVNGQTQRGSVQAGNAVTTTSDIMAITFIPNYLAVGARTTGIPDNRVFIKEQPTMPIGFMTYGKVADTFRNGQPVKKGDQLTSSISISTPKTKLDTLAITQTVITDNVSANINVWSYQNSTIAGQKAGYLSLYVGSNQEESTTDQVYEPIFYYVLPSATIPELPIKIDVPNSNNGQVILPKSSYFKVGDRIVVKLDYSHTGFNFNTSMNANSEIQLLNSPLAANGNYPWDIYVISSATHLTNPKYSSSTMNNFSTNAAQNNFNPAWVQNNLTNLYHVGGGNWTINQVSSFGMQTMVKANEDLKMTTMGLANDKKSPEVTFEAAINTGNNTSDANITFYLSLPSQVNGSGFSYYLDGPISFENIGNLKPLVSYSSQGILFTENEPDFRDFNTHVSDWSKVKTIKVTLNGINQDNFDGRVILHGTIPSLAQDAGKTGYLNWAFYADNAGQSFKPDIQKKDKWTSVRIVGKSTVKSRLHYVDANGISHYIDLPNNSYTYKDNDSTFLTKEAALAALSVADKELIPKNYYFDGQIELLKAPIKSWQTSAPILKPEFGQTVRYYYNGSIIQYELVAKSSDSDKDNPDHSKEAVDHDNDHQPEPNRAISNNNLNPKINQNIPLPSTPLPVDKITQSEPVDENSEKTSLQVTPKQTKEKKTFSENSMVKSQDQKENKNSNSNVRPHALHNLFYDKSKNILINNGVTRQSSYQDQNKRLPQTGNDENELPSLIGFDLIICSVLIGSLFWKKNR